MSQSTSAVADVLLKIRHCCVQLNRGFTFRHIILKFAPDKYSVRRNRHRACLDQPDMPVNAGAFIKPALKFRGIHADRQRVAASAMGQIGDVVSKTAVAAFVMADEIAV